MRRITLVALTVVLAAGAPASAQNREHQQMAAELRILQQQNRELTNLVTQLMQALNDTTKALNARIDQTNDAMRKGFADQSLTLNATASDVRKTFAQTQDASTRVGELREEVQALRSQLPAILARLAALTAVDPAATVDPAVTVDPTAVSDRGVPDVSAEPSTLGLSPQRMYDTAWADYTGGNYQEAIRGFREFLKVFATSNRADDAQYFIGESEYLQNRFEPAITAYNLVIQNYPKSEHVPWAYYRRGLSQARLQQADAARASYETVIKQFPNTEAAIGAENSLQRLDNTQPPAGAPPRRP